MDIVQTPSAPWLENAAASCVRRIDISSPFVGQALVTFLGNVSPVIERTLLTRTRLVDFASGASDLSAVIALAETGVAVLGLDRLHAKVYVFDESIALVTSANATYSGWHKNAECGIGVHDASASRSLATEIRSGFGASPHPSRWSAKQLQALIPAIDLLKKDIPKRTRIRIKEGADAEDLSLSKNEAELLSAKMAPWTRLVLDGAQQFSGSEFSTQQVFDACHARIARDFPENFHPREKVRQQLQILRDLGLIKVVGRGRYRSLVG